MFALRKLAESSCLMLCGCVVVNAQESAAGNAVAEQLAQSSLRMIGSLTAVLALVAVCGWALRRWRDHKNVESDSIEIVSGISLGSKDRVVLLRVGNEQVLVGVSPAGMQSLHVVRHTGAPPVNEGFAPDSSAPTSPAAVPPAFNLTLGAAQ